MFDVRTGADGSAEVDTKTAYNFSSTARVMVSPGFGPRVPQLVTFTNVCGYRVIPD